MDAVLQSPRTRVLVSLLAAGSALLGASPASSQTIRPVIAEYQLKAEGKFEVVNDSDRPLNVVVQPRGFAVDDTGAMRDVTLPADLQIQLSASSVRLPARQSRFIFYKATAVHAPAWFVLYANFSGFPGRGQSGLNVQLELPHVVYLLPKTRLAAADVQATATLASGRLTLELDNRGDQFGRVTGLDVRTATNVMHLPGFALFPGARRVVALPWDADEAPIAVAVKTKEFSVERVLTLDPAPVARVRPSAPSAHQGNLPTQ